VRYYQLKLIILIKLSLLTYSSDHLVRVTRSPMLSSTVVIISLDSFTQSYSSLFVNALPLSKKSATLLAKKLTSHVNGPSYQTNSHLQQTSCYGCGNLCSQKRRLTHLRTNERQAPFITNVSNQYHSSTQ
jgi:hypothetical protein